MPKINKVYELMEVRKSGGITKPFALFKPEGSSENDTGQFTISYHAWIRLEAPAYIMVDITPLKSGYAKK